MLAPCRQPSRIRSGQAEYDNRNFVLIIGRIFKNVINPTVMLKRACEDDSDRRSELIMTKVDDSRRRRALIVGGSLGGLFAGNLLRRIGWNVDIFERSPHDLDSRGGGIVLQTEVVEVLRR